MAIVNISEARDNLRHALDLSATEEVTLQRYGKPAAVLISPARYEELLEAWEEAQDVRAFDEAMAEEGANIPWEQVRADLGWE